jgi:beta-glucosidase
MTNRTYRYFTGKPLYGFGYGLSYTNFAFTGIKLSNETLQAGQPLTVEGELRNTGTVAGEEVAELYLTPPKTDVSPRLALIAFQRVHLSPGESKHLQFDLSPRQLSVVDNQGHRAVAAGSYTLYLGGGQPGDAQDLHATFAIEGHEELPR